MKQLIISLALIAFTVQLLAQDFPNPKPTDAHKVLAKEAGTWNTVIKMYLQGPTEPATEYKGVETIEMVSGGLFSRTTFKCKMGDRDFEGHGLFGYDPRTKEYTGTWVDSFSTIPTQLKGKHNAENKTLTMHATIVDTNSGQEIKQKQVTKFVDDKTKTFTIFMLMDAGGQEQEIKIMEMTAKKR
jgi:hypothetical protein